jgi:hypothetical protein
VSQGPEVALAVYVEQMAAALSLPIDPAWRDAVARNLAGHLAAGRLLMDFPLPDEPEPAPTFEP